MKALIALIVVAGAAAAVYFLFLGGGGFGVDAGHPLGTWEAIKASCAERDLPEAAMSEREVRSFFGDEVADREGITVVKFLGHAPRFPHFVAVARDASGKVVACGGQGASQLFTFTTMSVPPTVGFLAKYWLDVVGEEPVYRDEQFAAGAEAVRMRGDIRKGRVSGSWIKDWGGGMKIAHQVTDRVVLVLY